MSLCISKCSHNLKKNIKAYRIGKSIILPHVRYIDNGGRNSMMFHSQVTRLNGHYQTLGCDRMDVSGLCLGHKMSKEEFLKKYCDGIEPEIETNKE
jgi:hypothetical protein